MRLARQCLAVVVAALQLALPLAAYARAPFVPGAGDLCSAARAPGDATRGPAHRPSPATPLHHHGGAHCALCAHGAPPALLSAVAPLAPFAAIPFLALAATRRTVASAPHTRADARAPPVAETRTA